MAAHSKPLASQPRHGQLSEQLAPILEWMRRPVGVNPFDKTTWSTSPINDNSPEDLADMHAERRLRIIPSLVAIMESVAADDVERNEDNQIVRIGALRFSDGSQREKAYRYTIDGKLLRYEARMPVGAMLHTKDAQEQTMGGMDDAQEVAASNRYIAEIMGTANPQHIAAGERRPGKSYSHSEAKAMLAEAWSNTDWAKVNYTYGKPALPCAGTNVSDSFLGMRRGKCGDTGTIAWEDIASARASRHMWAEVTAQLPKRDVAVLEAATTASSFAELGGGGKGNAAKRRGKRALLAANDNILAAMQKVAA